MPTNIKVELFKLKEKITNAWYFKYKFVAIAFYLIWAALWIAIFICLIFAIYYHQQDNINLGEKFSTACIAVACIFISLIPCALLLHAFCSSANYMIRKLNEYQPKNETKPVFYWSFWLVFKITHQKQTADLTAKKAYDYLINYNDYKTPQSIQAQKAALNACQQSFVNQQMLRKTNQQVTNYQEIKNNLDQ